MFAQLNAKAQRLTRTSQFPARVIAAAIACYFLYFARDGVRAHFAPDDMMNLGLYWARGFLLNLADNFRFWSHTFRPMGALFYLPIYRAFGLNPLPYRIAALLILAVNVYLSYRVAKLVSRSKAAAALAAVLVCANYDKIGLFYSTSLIYDILSYFFILLMLFLYIRVRSRELTLTFPQGAMVVCAYIAALNSKEIAVVGAGWVLAYEVLMQRPRALRLPLILVAVGLLFTACKMYGPESLSQVEGYTMEFSLRRFIVNNSVYVNEMLYSEYFDRGSKLFIGWGILSFLCWIPRSLELRWCWFLVSTATLPISFTAVDRGGPSLYVPLFAWALLLTVFLAVVLPRPVLRWSVMAALAVGFAAMTIGHWRERAEMLLPGQRLTWSVLTQIRDLKMRPAGNSKVIFLNNPFEEFDTLFIAELVWNDPTIVIKLANKMPVRPAPAEMEAFDWILDFEGEKLQVVRAR